MNPAHKPGEERLLALFRSVWAKAEEIASAEISDAPDVRGVLVGGRRFGMEIVALTENDRAKSDEALKVWFASELQATCTAKGIGASFALCLADYQADRFVDKAHRARIVAFLVQLSLEANGQRVDLGEEALEARGFGDLNCAVVEPIPEGIEFYFTRSGRGLGSEFVRERIAQKDDRAAAYRAAIGDADLWLLLVVGTKLSASVIRPSRAETFETRFDRVFFMECWQDIEKVTELAIRRKG